MNLQSLLSDGKLPGVTLLADGSLQFEFTNEEQAAADSALAVWKDVLIHPEFAERIQNGVIAVELSHYALQLFARYRERCSSASEGSSGEPKDPVFKAVAAVWKAYSLTPLPAFLFHRAAFLQGLGYDEDARKGFRGFKERLMEFQPDALDRQLTEHEGSNLAEALAYANDELAG